VSFEHNSARTDKSLLPNQDSVLTTIHAERLSRRPHQDCANYITLLYTLHENIIRKIGQGTD